MATTTATLLGLTTPEWTLIFGYASLLLAFIYGFSKIWVEIKKNDPKLIKDFPQEAETIGKDAMKIVKEILQIPVIAAIVGKEKLEAHHIAGKLTELELQQSALKGVSVFNNALGVKLGEMTTTQKMDLSEFVKAELGAKVKVSDLQIVAVLTQAQKSLDSVESTVIPAVQAHEAALKAWGSMDAPKKEAKTIPQPVPQTTQA